MDLGLDLVDTVHDPGVVGAVDLEDGGGGVRLDELAVESCSVGLDSSDSFSEDAIHGSEGFEENVGVVDGGDEVGDDELHAQQGIGAIGGLVQVGIGVEVVAVWQDKFTRRDTR